MVFANELFELRSDVDTLSEALPVDGKLDNGTEVDATPSEG
jgi:hypothetical protein